MILARLASLVLFVAIGAYAVFLAVQDRREQSMRAVASRLDLRRAVTVEQVATTADRILNGRFDHGCRSDILRPALTVALFNLDRMNQAKDYNAWVKTHVASQSFIATMVRCLPADGNLWLREALVSRAIAEDPRSPRQKLTVSLNLMPYEAPQVFARLFLWKRLSPFALETSGSLAEADIRATLLYGSDRLKTSLHKDMSAAFETLVKRQSATPLPD